jgi:CRP-like cAMP-binding protein
MTPGNDSSKGDLYRKGQLLIRQGEEPRYMYYMHSGALEILSAPPEYEELHTDILLSRAKGSAP